MMKAIFKWTYVGIIFYTVLHFARLQAQKANLGQRLYSPQLQAIISSYLNVQGLKKDWLGRLYCVVNPNLNERGIFDTNLIIYELDAQGLQYSNMQFVESWLVNKLRIIQDVFKQRDLFSHLEFDVKHVGPANQDNYLVTISPDEATNFLYWFPKFLKRTAIWTILFIIACVIFFIV